MQAKTLLLPWHKDNEARTSPWEEASTSLIDSKGVAAAADLTI